MSFFSLLFSLPIEFSKNAQKNLPSKTKRNIYLSSISIKPNNVFFLQFSQESLLRFYHIKIFLALIIYIIKITSVKIFLKPIILVLKKNFFIKKKILIQK